MILPRTATAVGMILIFAVPGSFAGKPQLTPEAEAAVRQLFPDGSILAAGQETEQGVKYFEVVVRNGETRVKIEVAADGSVGEVESEVALNKTPQAVRDEIARLPGPALLQAERHVIHGVARDGRFAALETPVVVYEVEYKSGGTWKEVLISEDGQRLAAEEQDDDDSEDDASEDDESET